jgi:hypothetical protein
LYSWWVFAFLLSSNLGIIAPGTAPRTVAIEAVIISTTPANLSIALKK